MDPGNWATDLQGGSQFGYTLLSVILLSNLMAMLLQALSAKLGIVTGRDLAQACRETYSRPTSIFLWVVCEIAIAACDLAEVLGSAVALQLLFHIPLLLGVILTALDILLVLLLQGRGFRMIEALVITLILTIGGCFAYEIFFARPLWLEAAHGFLPNAEIFRNGKCSTSLSASSAPPSCRTISISIRAWCKRAPLVLSPANAARLCAMLSSIPLSLSVSHSSSTPPFSFSARLPSTHAAYIMSRTSPKPTKLLSPTLGASFASTLFACALLASGQNSTLTGTLAGQIVMEGFLQIRLKPWLRRLITRGIAILPAILVIGLAGESKVGMLLVLSQVILSFQLPFAVIPLVQFTSDRRRMGEFRKLTPHCRRRLGRPQPLSLSSMPNSSGSLSARSHSSASTAPTPFVGKFR